MIKITVLGASGRMGKALIRLIATTPNTILVGATTRPNSAVLGKDAGELADIAPLGIGVTDDLDSAFKACDVVIDFTPQGRTAHHLDIATTYGTKIVIGSTGLSNGEESLITQASKTIPILYASNFSIGMNTLFAICERISPTLSADMFNVHIDETHHIHKLDAPSGTALSLGKYVAQGRGDDFNTVYKYDTPRTADSDITFTDNRHGDVIGDHTVRFNGELESLHLTHNAHSRDVFADGAIKGAIWLHSQPTGLYTMRDMLGLN